LVDSAQKWEKIQRRLYFSSNTPIQPALHREVMHFSPAQVTSKHKHRCCPCPKWADFVYSLILD